MVCYLQICECSVLSARLEVLNLSENRLTDACSSYLSTILENCKGAFLPYAFVYAIIDCFIIIVCLETHMVLRILYHRV